MTWASHVELRLLHQGGRAVGGVARPQNKGLANENAKERVTPHFWQHAEAIWMNSPKNMN